MTGHVLRYDPQRIDVLRQRVREAAAHLDTIVSRDPAAIAAVRAAVTAHAALAEHWLPVLDRLSASDAMLTWSPTAVGGLAARWSDVLAAFATRTGPDLGRAMAAIAAEVVERGDRDDIVDLTEALQRNGHDVEGMRTFLTVLGGDGAADLLMALGTAAGYADEALTLAGILRTRLAEDSLRPGFPAGFAGAMAGRFFDSRDDEDLSPAAALAYLLDDTTFDTDFLVATTRSLVGHELALAGDEPRYGASAWMFRAPSILLRQLDDGEDDADTSEYVRSDDPMYALLEDIALDGDAGRAIFTDDRMATYLLGQRDVRLDGMRRLAAAAETAAAGPDVVIGASEQLLDAASMVASAFVNHVGARPRDELFTFSANRDTSRSAARIIGQHVLAVQNAVLVGDQDTTDGRRGQPYAAVVGIEDEARRDGVVATGASFDGESLGVITDLAVDSTDGVAVIRAALDLHERAQATFAVDRVVTGDLPPRRDPNLLLGEAMRDTARLEAYFIAHAGHRAEERGRSVDRLISAWIGLASLSIGQGNDHFEDHGATVGAISAPIIGELLGPAADLATSLFATHEAAAARSAEANAEAATDQLVYLWCRQAYGRGLIVPDLPPGAVANGELVGWETFLELPPHVRTRTLNQLEETTGRAGVNLDSNDLRDAVKTEQLRSYVQLE